MQTDMSGNRMFYLLASMTPKNYMCSQAEAISEWHCRFRHLNNKELRTLSYKKMVVGLPSLKSPKKICTTCLTDKQLREPVLRRSLWRALKQL